jgi:putative RNA 2'-phosphotransferase
MEQSSIEIFVKISKYLAYMLRHHPESAGITLDEEGFTDLPPLLKILNARYKDAKVGEITKNTIEEMIRQSDKRRYEILGNKIRALYGHSVAAKVVMQEATEVPQILYHGTTLKAYEAIKMEGIKKRTRQFAHLTDNVKIALEISKRRTNDPVVLSVDTKAARNEGIKFYKSGDMYLTDYVPPQFLSVIIPKRLKT